MKRRVVILSVSMCLLFAISLPVQGRDTHTNIIELCEKYVYMCTKLDLFDSPIFSQNMPIIDMGNGEILVSSSIGSINTHTDDFRVSNVVTGIMDLTINDDNKMTKLILRAAVVMACLEFDEFDEFLADIEGTTITNLSLDIISTSIMPKINDTNAMKRLVNGEKITVYEGNYKYELSYQELTVNDRKLQNVYLVANKPFD